MSHEKNFGGQVLWHHIALSAIHADLECMKSATICLTLQANMPHFSNGNQCHSPFQVSNVIRMQNVFF